MTIHGRHQVELVGNILQVKLIGSFNDEGVRAYSLSVQQAIEHLKGQPFAMLIDDLDVEGGTPEAFEELDKYNLWLATKPIIAKAFIIKSLALKEIILERTPALKNQEIAFFEDHVSALAWLQQKLS